MERIRFFKDKSNRIKLGNTTYRPLTLEEILNLESAFYAGTSDSPELENPISEWFNYRGLTYVKQ